MVRTLCVAIVIGSAVAGAAQLPTGPGSTVASVVHTNVDAGPQFDLLANDIFSPPADRRPAKFVMQGRIIEDDEGDAIRTSTNVPNLDASIMLSQAGIDSVTNATLMAWRKGLDGAIVTGQRGTNYVAALLYRSPSEGRPWRRSFMFCYTADRGCIHIWSSREYDHPPTQVDAQQLLSCFGGYPRKNYIFSEPPR